MDMTKGDIKMNKELKWLNNLGWFVDKDNKRYKKLYEDSYNYIKQALSTPKITSEQVKEDIARIRDDFEFYSLSINNSLMLNMSKKGLHSLNNITQYISQLEKSDASKEQSSIDYYNEMRKCKSQLNTITAENIELENSLRIAQDRIKELENKYELDGYDEGRY